uniref:Uncharacterized protein n=1 Tax=Timema monikensis TaxID=170555 RepID=A0A7R9HV31_9NEOP|nr:unnamed protein product [Timema monikensis]
MSDISCELSVSTKEVVWDLYIYLLSQRRFDRPTRVNTQALLNLLLSKKWSRPAHINVGSRAGRGDFRWGRKSPGLDKVIPTRIELR